MSRPYPRANEFLELLPRDIILRWLNDYPSGQIALAALEDKLTKPDGHRKGKPQ